MSEVVSDDESLVDADAMSINLNALPIWLLRQEHDEWFVRMMVLKDRTNGDYRIDLIPYTEKHRHKCERMRGVVVTKNLGWAGLRLLAQGLIETREVET